MNATRRKRFIWPVAVVVSIGIGLWFAHFRGWLDPAYARMQSFTQRTPGGMDPNMPGMDMGSMKMGQKGKPSAVAAAAERRLELWDVPADEIKQLEDSGKAHTHLTLRSPLGGTVLTKDTFPGSMSPPRRSCMCWPTFRRFGSRRKCMSTN